jgi:hypothetical protein
MGAVPMNHRSTPSLLSDKPLESTRRLCDCYFCHEYAYTSEYRLNDPEYVRHWCYRHNRWWKRVIYRFRINENTPHALAIATLAIPMLLFITNPLLSFVGFLAFMVACFVCIILCYIGKEVYSVLYNFFNNLL